MLGREPKSCQLLLLLGHLLVVLHLPATYDRDTVN
jgi:hypothetical protein